MSTMDEVEAVAGGIGDDPTAPRLVRALRGIDRAIARLEEAIVGLALLALILLGVYKAITLNLFPPSPFWIGEMLRYAVFCIGLIGAALAAQSNRLFNIDLMTRLFGPRGRLVIRVITTLFTIAVCLLVLKASLLLRGFIADEEGEVLAPKWGMLSLPAAMVLIIFHNAVRLVSDLVYLFSGRVPPELERPQVPHP
jgi:TRAP-type C4-dicarboxylate transport system permease small subunit